VHVTRTREAEPGIPAEERERCQRCGKAGQEKQANAVLFEPFYVWRLEVLGARLILIHPRMRPLILTATRVERAKVRRVKIKEEKETK
jgi:hypothetical protein